ncbi:Ubiquitin-conjugating enzyme E2 J1 [Thelohanellus kitauei]|uniref:Ubiquitin-conjugating enzyme E2 J1 n=1 Tax=Thelohanellus kitauei TaxID=669202 RepID=A0A0C2M8F3_THEKT|nr:Ubiquitin-conjugating enzyme E2 J1 [Thelohanellus kitauei]
MSGSNNRLYGVKRLLREVKELSVPTSEYYACPLEQNIFEWHFTIRGPSQTPFENGIYHGRIIFPTDYPIKPPEIIFLTPNGRFQTNKKICLSVSSYHPEQWRPCWGVRTMLLAIIGFLPSPTEGAIGSADISDTEKVRLAQKFIFFKQ